MKIPIRREFLETDGWMEDGYKNIRRRLIPTKEVTDWVMENASASFFYDEYNQEMGFDSDEDAIMFKMVFG